MPKQPFNWGYKNVSNKDGRNPTKHPQWGTMITLIIFNALLASWQKFLDELGKKQHAGKQSPLALVHEQDNAIKEQGH